METSSVTFKSLLKWYAITALTAAGVIIAAICILEFIAPVSVYSDTFQSLNTFFGERFLIYVLVGFSAQMIDGALGMAYGISSTTFLMSAGISPAVASASVHVAEVFTTAASGISHWRLGNVNKNLFLKLVIPGAVGAAIGAYVLSSFDGKIIKPYISAYLLIMGIVILFKAFRRKIAFKEVHHVKWLALFGGFADASGGGGWGPVVASTLIGRGNHPKPTIGSVNAAEFFITLSASGVFTLFIGITHWQIIAALILGGIVAAPVAALITHRINHKISMIFVGLLIVFLSVRTILLEF
ncbi:MAG TPA: sulfite exporter TauE/SafE family protein [Chitinophagales bacterium]|nr:sulfite exporter TauE/SafE family protein [Chitinophagales bacterium]